MALRNTAIERGVLAGTLHWLVAVGIFAPIAARVGVHVAGARV